MEPWTKPNTITILFNRNMPLVVSFGIWDNVYVVIVITHSTEKLPFWVCTLLRCEDRGAITTCIMLSVETVNGVNTIFIRALEISSCFFLLSVNTWDCFFATCLLLSVSVGNDHLTPGQKYSLKRSKIVSLLYSTTVLLYSCLTHDRFPRSEI